MVTLVIGTNSYTDEATATAYITDFVGDDAWAAASVAEREGALVEATQAIDLNFNFLGTSQTATQTLAFPREEFNYYDRVLDRLITVAAGTYPEKLVNATIIQAAHLLTFKSELSSNNTGLTFSRIMIDVIEVEDTSRAGDTSNNINLVSDTVRKLLGSFTVDGAGTYGNSWWRAN